MLEEILFSMTMDLEMQNAKLKRRRIQDSSEEPSFSSSDMSSSSRVLPDEGVTPSTRRNKKSRVTQEDVYSKIISLLERKNEQEREDAENQRKNEERQQQLQHQMVENQRIMAEAMIKLGEGLTALSKVAECLIKNKCA